MLQHILKIRIKLSTEDKFYRQQGLFSFFFFFKQLVVIDNWAMQ